MGIFPDAQRQLTPQSLVRSGRISNSSEMLWFSLLPAKMKRLAVIFQNPARKFFWEAGIVMQSYMLDTVQ